MSRSSVPCGMFTQGRCTLSCRSARGQARSVVPAARRVFRGGRHLLHHLGPRKRVPAVTLLGATVGEIRRLAFLLEHVLEIIYGEVQVEVVHVAGEEMQLAGELGPKRSPVAFRIRTQIKSM